MHRRTAALLLAGLAGCKGVGSWVLVRADRDAASAWASVYQLELAGDLPTMYVPAEASLAPLDFTEPLEFTLSTHEKRGDDVTVQAVGIGDGGVEILAGSFVIPWSEDPDAEVTLCLGLPGGTPSCPRLAGSSGGGGNCAADIPAAAHVARFDGEGCTQQYASINVSCPACTVGGMWLAGTLELTALGASQSFEVPVTAMPTSLRFDMPFRYEGEATLSMSWRAGPSYAASSTTPLLISGNLSTDVQMQAGAGMQDISVILVGSGSGAVTSSPPGISCPGTCTAPFYSATTLMAQPAPGSRLRYWSGCQSTSGRQCTAALGATITAEFASWQQAGSSANAIQMYGGEGWIVGNGGSTWRTYDAGTSWTAVGGATGDLRCISAESTYGYAAGVGVIERLSYGSWSNAYSMPFTTFDDCVKPVGSSSLYLAGPDGLWLFDGTNAPQVVWTQAGLRALALQGSELWGVGTGGTVLRVSGIFSGPFATYTPQSSNTFRNLMGVDFVDTAFGLVVGESGVILKTFDGGGQWIVLADAVYPSLYDIDLYDYNYAVAVGTNGTVLVTENGGNTWYTMDSQTSESIVGVQVLGWGNALLITQAAAVLRLQDLLPLP